MEVNLDEVEEGWHATGHRELVGAIAAECLQHGHGRVVLVLIEQIGLGRGIGALGLALNLGRWWGRAVAGGRRDLTVAEMQQEACRGARIEI